MNEANMVYNKVTKYSMPQNITENRTWKCNMQAASCKLICCSNTKLVVRSTLGIALNIM